MNPALDSKRYAPPPSGKARLIVEKNSNIRALNSDSQVEANIRQVILDKGMGSEKSFYDTVDFSDIGNLEVEIREGQKTRVIDLPPEMREKIVRYLQQRKIFENSGFDCASFAHYLQGVEYRFDNFIPDKWKFEAFNPHTVSTGDTIILFKNEDKYSATHFAIYLADGLYLSKFGMSGSLIVTTISEMQDLFGGYDVVRATPFNAAEQAAHVNLNNQASPERLKTLRGLLRRLSSLVK